MRPFDWQKWLLALVVLILAASGAFYLSSAKQPVKILYVPKADLSAYHLITAADLMTTTLPTAVLPSKPILLEADLVGRYTRQALTAEKPVKDAQLVPAVHERYVTDTAAISIPATAAITYNGQLASGAIVKVWSATDAMVLLDEVLVLDIQKVETIDEADDDTRPYVIVLAVPSEKQAALITAAATGSLILTIVP